MLLLMDANATQAQIAAAVERIESLGFSAHVMPGRQTTAIGVTGNTGPIPQERFSGLPGLSRAIPVSEPFKLVGRAMKPEGTTISLPTTSFTYVQAGSKSVQTFAITETFYRRFEVGYAISRFYMGSLPHVIRRTTGIDIDRNDVYLHHFNLRAMLIEENSVDLPLPVVTAGVHFKYNDGIRSIDNHLGGVLGMIGFERSNGVDFTLTASKTFGDLLFGRPVMASVGLRNSQGSQLGYLGFSDHWATTVEANVVCLVTDWLAVGYEFRQKTNPYDRIAGLVGDEDNWHTVCVGWVVNEHLTVCAGWGYLGTLANSDNNNAVALQLKYEF